jgi:hypothetical protein
MDVEPQAKHVRFLVLRPFLVALWSGDVARLGQTSASS